MAGSTIVFQVLSVLLVAGTGGERHVQGSRVSLAGAAATWIERPLVDRDEQDAVVVPELVLCPVPVVHVPVEDREPVYAELSLCESGRHGDVVEEAEAHRAIAEGVVAGRPYEGEARLLDGLDRGPGRESRHLEARGSADRVRIQEDGLAALACTPHPLDVVGVVNEFQFGERRGPRFHEVRECLEDGCKALRPLRMAPCRMQSPEAGMADQRQHVLAHHS